MSTLSRYWIITDLETSGIYPEQGHEILQIARVIYDVNRNRIIEGSDVMSYVIPTMWDSRNEEALEVNRLNETFLKAQGTDLKSALKLWSSGIDWKRSVVAAWGIDFESKFLNHYYNKLNISPPYHHHMIDLRTLAYLYTDLSSILGLREASQRFNGDLDPTKQHDAMYDVEQTAHLIRLLMADH